MKTSKQHLRLILALCLLAVMATPAFAQFESVGPQLPPARPDAPLNPVQQKMADTFKKFFNKSGETETKTEISPEDKNKPLPAVKEPVQPAPQYKRPPLISAPAQPIAKIETPTVDPENPPPVPRVTLDDPKNPLGFADAQTRLKSVQKMIQESRIAEAKHDLVPLRQWLIDSMESHLKLYEALNKVPSARAQSELEKQLALEFALLRDDAMYNLGRIYVAEKDYKKAVKELTEVIKSQPRSQMGINAYQMLQEIGFTEKLQLAQ